MGKLYTNITRFAYKRLEHHLTLVAMTVVEQIPLDSEGHNQYFTSFAELLDSKYLVQLLASSYHCLIAACGSIYRQVRVTQRTIWKPRVESLFQNVGTNVSSPKFFQDLPSLLSLCPRCVKLDESLQLTKDGGSDLARLPRLGPRSLPPGLLPFCESARPHGGEQRAHPQL